MHRVCVVMSNFWPEPTGGSPTATEFAVFLREGGLDVRVVTSMPYYPQWEIWPQYRGRLWQTEWHDGVRIFRSWHIVPRRVSTAGRLLHELSLTVLAVPNFLRSLAWAEVVFVFTPALSFAFAGGVLTRMMRKPIVVVVKDVMPDAAIELGMLRSRVAIRLSRYMAKWLYNHAVEVHTLGEGMRRRISTLCARPGKIKIVPDTVDGKELFPIPAHENEFRKRFVPPGTFAVLHTGNMGKKQDLNLILRAAALLRGDSSVHFYVFGDGAVKHEFLARRAALRLENVSHYPLQERWMLRHMLSGADVVLVSQLRQVVDIVVPSKLLTAMVSGAMIVAACPPDSETSQILLKSGGGVVVPAEDELALVDAINRIRTTEDVSRHRGAVRAYALRSFDRSSVYGPIAETLKAGVLGCSLEGERGNSVAGDGGPSDRRRSHRGGDTR